MNSVLNQTFCDYELIIIDDGSTDDTKKMVLDIALKKSDKIKYIYQPNQGVSQARNRGVKEAKGKFIGFLDSDDRFLKQKLEITHSYIKRYPKDKIFHTEEIWYRQGQLLTQKSHHKKPNGYVFQYSIKSCCISITTAMIKKDIFNKFGYFDEKLPACEDYDFWLRVTSKLPIVLIPKYLTIKEGGRTDQQSKKYPAMDRDRKSVV